MEYKTSDMYITAALMCYGATYTIERSTAGRRPQAIMKLEYDGDIEELVKRYSAKQLKVDSKTYKANILELKDAIHNNYI
jgi:hypothetical protein